MAFVDSLGARIVVTMFASLVLSGGPSPKQPPILTLDSVLAGGGYQTTQIEITLAESQAERTRREWRERQARRAINTPKRPSSLVVLARGLQYCSCVTTAKALSGINIGSIGAARNHPTNSKTPTVGAIVKTTESSWGANTGHLGVVTAVSDTAITIKDGNYWGCTLTQRTLPRDSRLIVGYYTRI